MSAVIHAVIYGIVIKLMRQMATGEAIVLAVVVIAAGTGCLVDRRCCLRWAFGAV